MELLASEVATSNAAATAAAAPKSAAPPLVPEPAVANAALDSELSSAAVPLAVARPVSYAAAALSRPSVACKPSATRSVACKPLATPIQLTAGPKLSSAADLKRSRTVSLPPPAAVPAAAETKVRCAQHLQRPSYYRLHMFSRSTCSPDQVTYKPPVVPREKIGQDRVRKV